MCVASVAGSEQSDGHTESRELKAEQEAGLMTWASLSQIHKQLCLFSGSVRCPSLLMCSILIALVSPNLFVFSSFINVNCSCCYSVPGRSNAQFGLEVSGSNFPAGSPMRLDFFPSLKTLAPLHSSRYC